MSLKAGDKFPNNVVFSYIPAPTPDQEGCGFPVPLNMDDELRNKTVVIVAVPGAFTPTCSADHIGPFVQSTDDLKLKGIDSVIVIAANDPFVMNAWANQLKAPLDYFKFASDPNAKFTSSYGLSADMTERGMGIRTKRFAMIVKSGEVTYLGVEPQPGVTCSGVTAVESKL